MLLKIHEFADFCGISTRTLHLYDKMGLFYPNKTDDLNGYRYYDTNQIVELNTILSFKKTGMSLKDIKDIIKNNYSKDVVIAKLKKQEDENKKKIEIATYHNKFITSLLLEIRDDQNTYIDPNQEAKFISKIVCLENDTLEHEFSQILWL